MQVTLRLGAPLRVHADGASELSIELGEPSTIADLLDVLAVRHPAVERRVRDEAGLLRPHVNVFVDGEPVPRRTGAAVGLPPTAEVLILPAVSGGAEGGARQGWMRTLPTL